MADVVSFSTNDTGRKAVFIHITRKLQAYEVRPEQELSQCLFSPSPYKSQLFTRSIDVLANDQHAGDFRPPVPVLRDICLLVRFPWNIPRLFLYFYFYLIMSELLQLYQSLQHPQQGGSLFLLRMWNYLGDRPAEQPFQTKGRHCTVSRVYYSLQKDTLIRYVNSLSK